MGMDLFDGPRELPSPGDLRTCSRWSCLHREVMAGPDTALLNRIITRAVQETAADLIQATEVTPASRAVEEYVGEYYQRFWSRAWQWLEPPLPKRMLEHFAAQGATCITNLATRMLPRMMAHEQYLDHDFPFLWSIPDGEGGEGTLDYCGWIDRAAVDRETGAIHLYTWRIEPADRVGVIGHNRLQRTGIPIGWGLESYPGQVVVLMETFLTSDVIWEITRTPQEMRLLKLVLLCQHRHIQHPGGLRPPLFSLACRN